MILIYTLNILIYTSVQLLHKSYVAYQRVIALFFGLRRSLREGMILFKILFPVSLQCAQNAFRTGNEVSLLLRPHRMTGDWNAG